MGPEHSDTLASLDVLALTLKYEKRYAESEKVYRETLERRRRALGMEHPDVAIAEYDFACVLSLEGKRDEAFSNLKRSVEHALSAEKRQSLEKDADFESLHGDPRFAALVATSRRRAAVVPTSN